MRPNPLPKIPPTFRTRNTYSKEKSAETFAGVSFSRLKIAVGWSVRSRFVREAFVECAIRSAKLRNRVLASQFDSHSIWDEITTNNAVVSVLCAFYIYLASGDLVNLLKRMRDWFAMLKKEGTLLLTRGKLCKRKSLCQASRHHFQLARVFPESFDAGRRPVGSVSKGWLPWERVNLFLSL